MVFQTPNAIEAILAGRKTQTRRLYKEGPWQFAYASDDGQGNVWPDGLYKNDHVVHYVGQVVSVQPGPGKKAVLLPNGQPLKVRILRMWLEDVRNIDALDAFCEGYDAPFDFLVVWCLLHSPKSVSFSKLSNSYGIAKDIMQESNADYTAIAYEFEVYHGQK